MVCSWLINGGPSDHHLRPSWDDPPYLGPELKLERLKCFPLPPWLSGGNDLL